MGICTEIRNNNNNNNNNILKEALSFHNEYRKKHGAKPLIFNNELSRFAQEYASKLAIEKPINPELPFSSKIFKGQALGENLFKSKNHKTGKEVTDEWYKEGEKYNFNKLKLQAGTAHFTQLIWKGTTDVGFGCKSADDGTFYFVAYYYPCGNNPTEFKDNVSEKRL